MAHLTIQDYNQKYKKNRITLNDFLTTSTDNGGVLIKVEDSKLHIKDILQNHTEYLSYLVDSIDLLPCGVIVYLKEN